MVKNKISIIGVSAIGSYGLLKLPYKTIDPYTRFSIGLGLSVSMVFSQNQVIRYLGVGIGIASFLQTLDIIKGGRLSFNNTNKKVFVLKESGGVVELKPNEIPNYNIDGFTIEGSKFVFKLSDGVYAGIDKDKIRYSFGVGKFVNSIRGAGKKDLSWCEKIANQGDNRWVELYKKSL